MRITDNILKICYIISGIIILLMIIIWVTYFPFSEDQWFEATLFQSSILIIVLSIGTVLLLSLSYLYKVSTTVGKVWLCLGIGMLFWTIGDFLYTYYELFTDEAPFPSIADFFYLAGYIPLSIGLIIQMRLTKINLSKNEKIAVLIIYSIIVLLITITVIILPYQEVSPIPESEFFAYFVAALYPIFDLILILCILVVFAKIRHGKINVAWILLLIGFLLNTIADIIFSWSENVGIGEFLFEPYELVFFISYVCIINGALTLLNIMTKTFETKTV